MRLDVPAKLGLRARDIGAIYRYAKRAAARERHLGDFDEAAFAADHEAAVFAALPGGGARGKAQRLLAAAARGELAAFAEPRTVSREASSAAA
jgi:hypothetical protein